MRLGQQMSGSLRASRGPTQFATEECSSTSNLLDYCLSGSHFSFFRSSLYSEINHLQNRSDLFKHHRMFLLISQLLFQSGIIDVDKVFSMHSLVIVKKLFRTNLERDSRMVRPKEWWWYQSFFLISLPCHR
jgi:hypothetical protein